VQFIIVNIFLAQTVIWRVVIKMKIKLEMELELDDDTLIDIKGRNLIPEDELKEELTERMFHACEDWVLRGQRPDLEFEK